ncbi:MAG: helix-turn-helix domain-containing protein [Plesiomonas shigelloides]
MKSARRGDRAHLATSFCQSHRPHPFEYLQRLRIQRACELLETTTDSFTLIANQVGYDDSGACRKAFIRIMGLTPSAFRQRFGR